MENKDTKYFKDFFTDKPVEYILNKPVEPEKIDKYLDNIKSYVSKIKDIITTSQLRNIFSEVKKINAKKIPELKMLRVRLAYVAGRSETTNKDKNKLIQDFYYNLDLLIKKVNKDNLENFKDFFEAIIAYHKYYGGK